MRVDQFFKILMGLAALGPVLYISGLFVQDSWTSLLSPLSYAALILAIYINAYQHTDDASYSAVLALHAATVAGWLYEVPRYLALEVPIIRFYRYGFFRVDYCLVSILVVILMLAWSPRYRPRSILIPGLVNYLAFYRLYLVGAPGLLNLRRALGITAYRAPAILLMITVCLFGENN